MTPAEIAELRGRLDSALPRDQIFCHYGHPQLARKPQGKSIRFIGILDSPYVQRVAVPLRFLAVSFTNEALSVFRYYDAFAAINPVEVAAVGVVLMGH